MADMRKTTDLLAAFPPVVSENDADCAGFGECTITPLHTIQYHGGQFLARNWVTIPHVTHHDDIDVSELEAWRKRIPGDAERPRPSLPILLLKALVEALRAFPKFNAALTADGRALRLKHYYNIGMAVDTDKGLLVPVLKNVENKTVDELATELRSLTALARGRGLPMEAMQGSSFTVSSIGNLGGTAFTPIINAPDVAILGLTRLFEKPQRAHDDQIVWRTHLPVSLSYDHRVINGADAARFISHLAEVCANPDRFLAQP